MLLLRASLILLLVLASTFIVAGCSSDDDDGGDGKKASKTSTDPSQQEGEDEDLVVVPGTGIAGVAVGDTEVEAIDALGEPDTRTTVPNEFSGSTNDRLEWKAPAVSVLVVPIPGEGGAEGTTEVIQVETTDDEVRTANGIGVGDRQVDVQDAYPDATCDTGDIIVCRMGGEEAGDIVTDFFVEGDRVTRIVVGRIVD